MSVGTHPFRIRLRVAIGKRSLPCTDCSCQPRAHTNTLPYATNSHIVNPKSNQRQWLDVCSVHVWCCIDCKIGISSIWMYLIVKWFLRATDIVSFDFCYFIIVFHRKKVKNRFNFIICNLFVASSEKQKQISLSFFSRFNTWMKSSRMTKTQ